MAIKRCPLVNEHWMNSFFSIFPFLHQFSPLKVKSPIDAESEDHYNKNLLEWDIRNKKRQLNSYFILGSNQRVIVFFPGYKPSPYWSPYEYAHNILHVRDHIPPHVAIASGFWFDDLNPYSYLIHKGHTSNQWNKCPKRGITTTGGQIPVEKHYRSLIGPMKALFRHATLAHFFIWHATFRQKFAWHRHSKFSPTLDILLWKALRMLDGANKPQGCRMLSRHSTLPFSSRHTTLPEIWPWHSTLWPPFMGPFNQIKMKLN